MEQFDSSLYAVCDRLRSFLRFLPPDIKKSVSEIRLRKNRPLSLTVNGKTFFVNKNGYIEGALSGGGVTVLNSDINESFRLLCASSAFAHEEELKEGFVSLKNGCRAGICGTLNASGFMRDITSINIRIAREIHGCADYILNYYKGQGLLIAGPPCSGKTTVLRELVRKLSNGDSGKFYRTAVIDSRLEISGGGICDLGACCDVLVSPDKAKGCEIALRTMFPDIIAFDEIGTAAELCRIKESFFSGVSVITTAHAGCSEELMERQVTRALLESGAIAQVALLPHKMGENPRILDTKELFYADAV